MGVFWIVCGLLAIFTPWWFAKEPVSVAFGQMFSLMDASGYVSIFPDAGSGVFILDWPYGRLSCPAYCFGLGMMGCGIIAALTPSVLMHRFQDSAIHQLSQPE
ncbi:MAG: hypothetical protein NTZ32_24345 [Planctomycetales bacterium]|nr:hypothetical protein [Planctomycetales bacterium]